MLRAFVTSTLSSSARQIFPDAVPASVKNCFGLHSDSAFGYVASPGRRHQRRWNQYRPASISRSAPIRPESSRQCVDIFKRSAAVIGVCKQPSITLLESISLLYVGGAATEETTAADASGIIHNRYARQSRPWPPQTRILLSPNPREMNARAPSLQREPIPSESAT